MIEFLWSRLVGSSASSGPSSSSNFDPIRDSLDIAVVGFVPLLAADADQGHARGADPGRPRRADRGARSLADLLGLATLSWILDNFLASAVLIIIVLFQADIRRALARVGRGVFPGVAERQESQSSRRSCAPRRRSRSAASAR